MGLNSVVSRTYPDGVDQKFSLNGLPAAGTIARPLYFGNSWTTLRIGVRCVMTDPGAQLTGTPIFMMGVMSNPVSSPLGSGVTNGLSSTTCSNFLGVLSQSGTWTYQTSPIHSFSNNVQMYAYKKVGNTGTAGSNYGGRYFSASPDTVRLAYILEITKTTTPVMNFLAPNNVWNDVSYATLVEAMQADTIALSKTILGSSAYILTGGTAGFTIDETTNGPLNAVTLAFYNVTLCSAEFSEVLVSRIS